MTSKLTMGKENLPDGWEVKEWSEVLEIKSGRSQKTVLNPNGKYPIIGSAGKIMGYADSYICNEGTTIIGRKGTINNPLFMKFKFWNVDTAFGLESKEKLSNIFLHYFCLSFNFRELDKGSGRPSLVKSDLLKVRIPLPSLPQQKQIVTILDKAFVAIDTAKSNAEQNLKNTKELFESYLQNIFENKGDDWVMEKLGSLGKLTSSKRIYKKEYVSKGVPFYRSKEIKELSNGKKLAIELFISEQRYLEIKSKFGIPKEGDLLLTAVGTIGEMYIVKKGDIFYFKDGNIMWLKNFLTLDSNYLKYSLTNFVEKLKSLSNGAAYNALTIEKLKEYSIPKPSLKEQKQIVKQLDALSAETKKLEAHYTQKITDLDELKKSILQKAFSGQLI